MAVNTDFSHKYTDTLFALTACGGVSGNEGDVRKIIEEAVRPLCDDVKIDTLGNLYAHKKGSGKSTVRAMACAHMDEVGLMVSWVRDDGLVDFQTVGGIDPRVLASKRVFIGKNRVPGVIGTKAIHLQSEDEYHSVMGVDKLHIDIGAETADEAKKLVNIGDYVVFDTVPELFGDGCVCAKALDDRVGCLALISALEEKYDCDFTAVFSVQEEIGDRGAMVTAAHVHPDVCIVLEGTSANDLGEVDEHLRVCELGKGVAVSFMDRSSLRDADTFKQLLSIAEEKGIPHQIKTFVAGGNDAGAIQRREGAVKICVLSVPCRNIHSPVSVCKISDIEAQSNLLKAFIGQL